MAIRLYNTLSKKVEDFVPVNTPNVTMYNCGPTVYSTQHIGNFRAFIVAELLRRVLEKNAFDVVQVMNITDVGHLTDDGDDGEDKLAVAAKKEQLHPLEIAKKYTDEFLADWNSLHILQPHFRPKATETISEMIALIKSLQEKGHAYVGENGNVYYDVSTFPDYGKLSGNTLEKLGNNRVEKDPNKKNQHDFVLWFTESKFENHILKWDSPWGEGYPGWHVECSAMAAKLLTPAFANNEFHPDKWHTIDIHTGGEDNRFPHHECEIAQSQGVSNTQYVKYWLHVTHLMIEGEKMSKSKGTVYYVAQLLDEGFSWRAIRYLLLSTHYRSPLNFTKEGLVVAQKNLERIDDVLKKLQAITSLRSYDETLALSVNQSFVEIDTFLADDLNTSGALGSLFEAIRCINKHFDHIGQDQAKELIDKLFSLDAYFGFFDRSIFEQRELTPELAQLLKDRAQARAQKDWETSDRLREELAAQGVVVTDTSQGQEWSYK